MSNITFSIRISNYRFMGLGPRNNNKELSHKIYTLRQSVQKVENVCYNIKGTYI